MAHVELSLSDDDGPSLSETHPSPSVRRWAGVVSGANEPCLVLDADGVIVALSPSALSLLGGAPSGSATHVQEATRRGSAGQSAAAGSDSAATASPHTTPDGESWIGRGLLDVLHLVDLTAAAAPLAAWEAERIPPLLTLSTGGLARAVMRFRLGGETRTVDAVSSPLRDGSVVAGSVTFLAQR